MRILIDVDGVISNFADRYLDFVQEVTGKAWCVEDVTQWSIAEACDLSPLEKKAVSNLIAEPGVAAKLEPLPGAVEAVKRLSLHHDIYFVTSPWASSPTWAYDRGRWLKRMFGSTLGGKVVHTCMKYVVAGDMLIDDRPSNVVEWVEEWGHKGTSVLWKNPANATWIELQGLVSRWARIRVAANWGDIDKLIEEQQRQVVV